MEGNLRPLWIVGQSAWKNKNINTWSPGLVHEDLCHSIEHDKNTNLGKPLPV